jgi:hypothetical protein
VSEDVVDATGDGTAESDPEDGNENESIEEIAGQGLRRNK